MTREPSDELERIREQLDSIVEARLMRHLSVIDLAAYERLTELERELLLGLAPG